MNNFIKDCCLKECIGKSLFFATSRKLRILDTLNHAKWYKLHLVLAGLPWAALGFWTVFLFGYVFLLTPKICSIP